MFATLKSLSRRLRTRRKVDPEAGPLGLSKVHLEGLERLTQQPLWRHWQEVMEVLLDQRVARLIGGLPHEEYLKLSGEVRLLIQLVALPETITATERVRNERQQPEQQRSTGHFVNTAFYTGAVASPGNGSSVGGR
jgi:hypothetical protein